MKEYTKITTVFKRDEKTKKIIKGEYANEEIKLLKDLQWEFTEKVDGTNIRINWDGYRITLGGRTDKAQIPTHLANKLYELFGGDANEQLFEQKFGTKEVTLYGEGYGVKIQNGKLYRDDVGFILFDICVDGIWLNREACEDIADYFGIEIVPVLLMGTIDEAVEYVLSAEHEKSVIAKNGAQLEGVVGRCPLGLLNKQGQRIIVKIKRRDF